MGEGSSCNQQLTPQTSPNSTEIISADATISVARVARGLREEGDCRAAPKAVGTGDVVAGKGRIEVVCVPCPHVFPEILLVPLVKSLEGVEVEFRGHDQPLP